MSLNEEESGTIVLPAAEFARVRKAVEVEDRRLRELGFAYASQVWAELPAAEKKAGGQKYDWAIQQRSPRTTTTYGGRPRYVNLPSSLDNQGLNPNQIGMIIDIGLDQLRSAAWKKGKPARPLKADAKLPTNKTTSFSLEDADLTFNKNDNSVEWETDDNNHSVGRAHNDPRYEVFTDALKTVKWTRNTGGYFQYTNENDRDPSPSVAYGPNGALHASRACVPYEMANGKRVTSHDLQQIFLEEMKAQALAFAKISPITRGQSSPQPRGHQGHAGQYTYRSRGESGVVL